MKYYKCIAKELSRFGFIFPESDQYFISNNVNNLIIGGIYNFTKVSETEWVQQEIDEGRLTTLPRCWCVKNDGSQLFKDTVLRYLNDKYNMGCVGSALNDFYGYDGGKGTGGTQLYSCKENFQNDPVELTIEQFIKLSGYKSNRVEEDFIKSIHVERPPIGLRPKDIYKTETTINRFNEVYGAIARYLNVGLPVNISWIEEYNELIKNHSSIISKLKSE